MSEAEEKKNKALVRWWWEEVWVKGNVAATDEFMAPNYVDHPTPPGPPPGSEGMKQALTTYRTALPDMKATIDDIFAGGDRVALRWSARGTHLGEWLDIPPTGHHFTMSGISIYRIAEGKAVEGWNSTEVNPTEEEQRWLTEGGGGWTRRSGSSSGDILPATERDTSPPFWDALTRNLTWRLRVEEARERERIEQELQFARRIQQASLPKEVPEPEGWEITPYYQPAREVGGDFYDFFELEDGRVGVVVGDATGKGVPAALVESATSSMFRAAAQALGTSSPGEVLAHVNEALLARIPPNMFVTCFYAIVEPKSGRLRYANAGHDLPYLRRRSGDDAEELRARGMPLGLMPEMSYEEKEASLSEGESVLLHSDGLVEAHDPSGEMFGFPRLKKVVEDSGGGEHLIDECLAELKGFVGSEWEQEDDITLVTLQRSEITR